MSSKQNVILTLRIEQEDGKVTEKTIEDAETIAYILDEAGLLDKELEKILGILL